MIISTATENIPTKVWTDSFVAVNIHPYHRLYFSEWIKKIAPDDNTLKTAYFRNHTGYYYYSMPFVWKNTTLIKRREIMYVIDCFTTETPHGKSPWTKRNILSLIRFVTLDQIPKIKICHMVASEHPEVIEGRLWLIATDVLDSEESVEYGFIDIDGTYLDEVDDSGSGEADVITGVTQSVTEEVEEVHRVVKYFSLLPYMLKPPSLITQGFNQNKKAHENIFNRVCNFGAQAE